MTKSTSLDVGELRMVERRVCTNFMGIAFVGAALGAQAAYWLRNARGGGLNANSSLDEWGAVAGVVIGAAGTMAWLQSRAEALSTLAQEGDAESVGRWRFANAIAVLLAIAAVAVSVCLWLRPALGAPRPLAGAALAMSLLLAATVVTMAPLGCDADGTLAGMYKATYVKRMADALPSWRQAPSLKGLLWTVLWSNGAVSVVGAVVLWAGFKVIAPAPHSLGQIGGSFIRSVWILWISGLVGTAAAAGLAVLLIRGQTLRAAILAVPVLSSVALPIVMLATLPGEPRWLHVWVASSVVCALLILPVRQALRVRVRRWRLPLPAALELTVGTVLRRWVDADSRSGAGSSRVRRLLRWPLERLRGSYVATGGER